MPTHRDVERLQALREAKRRGMLGPIQSAAVGELENRFSQYLKGVSDRAKSVVEPAMTAVSASIAEPVSGLVGLAALPFGVDVSTRAIEKTQDAMTYQPRSEAGQRGLQGLMGVLAPVGEAFEGASSYLGDAAYEATGSPAAGAAAYSIPALGLELLGLKGTRAASKAGKLGRRLEVGDIGRGNVGAKQRGAVGGVKGMDAPDVPEGRVMNTEPGRAIDMPDMPKRLTPEAAKRTELASSAMYGSRKSILDDSGRLDVDFDSALDDAVESGRMTPEQADFAYERVNSPDFIESAMVPLRPEDASKAKSVVANTQFYHGTPDADFVPSASPDRPLFVTSDKSAADTYSGGGSVHSFKVEPKRPFFIESTDITLDMETSPIGRKALQDIADEGYDAVVPLDYGDVIVLSGSALKR